MCFSKGIFGEGVLILWYLQEVLTSMCNLDETRIFKEARETLISWVITLEDKSTQENKLY
jgi:hypothetical protein